MKRTTPSIRKTTLQPISWHHIRKLPRLSQTTIQSFRRELHRRDNKKRSPKQELNTDKWTKGLDSLKHYSRYWHSLKRDLSTTLTGCILYDGKFFISTQLRKLVMNSIHRNRPGQTGMMHPAKLIQFPGIHRELVILTQNGKLCIKIGKSLNPVISKSTTSQLPTLNKPNEDVRFDFARPIPDGHLKNLYLIASVGRYSRYPHAKVYHNCDGDTAIKYLEKYIKFHGIPRKIRCDHAQAFKSRQFEIFCNYNNLKIILASVGEHRATGMIELLIQIIKRRLSVLNNNPK